MLHQSPTLSSARAAGHLKLAKLVRCMMQVTIGVTCIMQVICDAQGTLSGVVFLEDPRQQNAGYKNARCHKDRIAGCADIERTDIGKEQEGDE